MRKQRLPSLNKAYETMLISCALTAVVCGARRVHVDLVCDILPQSTYVGQWLAGSRSLAVRTTRSDLPPGFVLVVVGLKAASVCTRFDGSRPPLPRGVQPML